MEDGHWITVLIWHWIAEVTRELRPFWEGSGHALIHFQVIRTFCIEGCHFYVIADAFSWYEDLLLYLEECGKQDGILIKHDISLYR